MKMKSWIALACVVSVVLVVMWWRRGSLHQEVQPEAEKERVEEPGATPPAAVAEDPAVRPPSPARPETLETERPKPVNEAALMTRLRELADGRHSAEVLALAEEGNRRFPRSPDTPERDARAVRALVELNRHEEAELLARQLILEYPGTTWASDVGRHMFATKELWDKAMGGSR